MPERIAEVARAISQLDEIDDMYVQVVGIQSDHICVKSRKLNDGGELNDQVVRWILLLLRLRNAVGHNNTSSDL